MPFSSPTMITISSKLPSGWVTRIETASASPSARWATSAAVQAPMPGTVRSLAARKCGAVVIYSAGFSEAGEEGMRDQEELGRIAQEHGMVIEGPNCL